MANKTVTVKPSGGTYTTLAGAIAGELTANADLTAMAGILTISIEGNWSGTPDTARVDTAGFTTSASYYLLITTDSANKYTGKWDTTKYILAFPGTGDWHALSINTNYIWISGLQISIAGSFGSDHCINIGSVAAANLIKINNCGLKVAVDDTSNHHCITSLDEDAIVQMWNCVAWHTGTAAGGGNAIYAAVGASWTFENCTIWGGNRGIQNKASVCKAINCIAGNTIAESFYDNAWVAGGGYCAGDDLFGTQPGANSHNSSTFSFTDAANGDFRLLSTDTGAIDLGTSGVTLGFTDDVEGHTRTGTWDIGADEYVAAGGASVVAPNLQHPPTLLKGRPF
jgi:hypothetical protein